MRTSLSTLSAWPATPESPSHGSIPHTPNQIIGTYLNGGYFRLQRYQSVETKVPQICGFLFAKYSNHLQRNPGTAWRQVPRVPFAALSRSLFTLHVIGDLSRPMRVSSEANSLTMLYPQCPAGNLAPRRSSRNFSRRKRGNLQGTFTEGREERREGGGTEEPVVWNGRALHHRGKDTELMWPLTSSHWSVLAHASWWSFKLASAGSSYFCWPALSPLRTQLIFRLHTCFYHLAYILSYGFVHLFRNRFQSFLE